jgi:glucan phosphoethanolaminetransferase (alkaline phosphatase superfamily)
MYSRTAGYSRQTSDSAGEASDHRVPHWEGVISSSKSMGVAVHFTFSYCALLSTFQDRLDGLQSFLQMAKKTACNTWLKDFDESSRKHDLPLDEPCPVVLC